MSIFNPTLETQVAYEQPIQAPRQYSAVADLAETASNALRLFDRGTSTASADQSRINQFGTMLERAVDLNEAGKLLPAEITALRKEAVTISSYLTKPVPEGQKKLYESLTGESWDSVGYKDPQDAEIANLLQSETGRSLATAIKIQNPSYTQDEIDTQVLDTLSEISINQQVLALQESRAQRGLPVETSPIVKSIQDDFSLLAAKVAEYQQDGIITRQEYLSATTSVRSLIASKYANFNSNKEVKAIQDQMFGMLDDIGKGVSTDPLEVQLDAVQVALTKAEFSPTTISIVRSLIKQNPETFKGIIEKELGERGESFVDALNEVWKAPSSGMKLEDIFNKRPEIGAGDGKNPSLMSVPTPDEDPVAYAKVVEGLSLMTKGVLPSAINNSEATRNEWLNSVNITASLVASQSDETILGERLLSAFAADGILGNLKIVYNLDPLNAEQTNQALQSALGSERVRQKNLLDQRLAQGSGEYFVIDANTGKLDINMDTLRQRAVGDALGQRRLAEIARIRSEINKIGGLERFLELPDDAKSGILQGSNFERIITQANLGETIKLVRNLKLIDNKVQKLSNLSEKYSSATDVMNLAQEPVTQPADQTMPEDDQREGTQSNPVQISGDLSETDQANIYNNLPSGSFFIDPSDGQVYRKP